MNKLSKQEKHKIANEAIDHWVENLLFAYAHELHVDDVLADNCIFCKKFISKETVCFRCPLSKIGLDCDGYESPWSAVSIPLYRDYKRQWSTNIIPKCERMLISVEKACDFLMNDKEI